MPESVSVQQESGGYKYQAFRLAAALIPRVPIRFADPVARCVGLALWAAMPKARRLVDANLSRIPGLEYAEPRRKVARGVFQHLALNYLDLFRVRRLTAAQILSGYPVDGEELFRAALARGRGVILLSAHLGNFDLAAARLGLYGVPVTLPLERIKPQRLFELICHLRTHHGIHVVPVDRKDSLRAMYAALQRGEVLSLTVDRDVLGTGIEVPMFGAPARIPTGAVLLARRSGATVLWASTWRDGRGRSRGAFLPVDLTTTDDSVPAAEDDGTTRATGRPRGQAALTQALRPVVALIEINVAAHPEQWMAALTQMWPDSAAKEEGTPVTSPVDVRA
jgi:phosphatidylinositol dimannoside acyltransferase